MRRLHVALGYASMQMAHPCNLELRIDIASVDDSANGAKVAFDGAFLRKEAVYVSAAPPRMQTKRSPPSHSRHRCG